jgi:hypothetical protein
MQGQICGWLMRVGKGLNIINFNIYFVIITAKFDFLKNGAQYENASSHLPYNVISIYVYLAMHRLQMKCRFGIINIYTHTTAVPNIVIIACLHVIYRKH